MRENKNIENEEKILQFCKENGISLDEFLNICHDVLNIEISKESIGFIFKANEELLSYFLSDLNDKQLKELKKNILSRRNSVVPTPAKLHNIEKEHAGDRAFQELHRRRNGRVTRGKREPSPINPIKDLKRVPAPEEDSIQLSYGGILK